MEQVLQSVIAQWGVFGIVLIGAGYIIYDNIRNNNKKNNISDKLDIMSNDMMKIKTDIPIIHTKLEYMDKQVSSLEEKFEDQLKTHVDNLYVRMESVEDKVDGQVSNFLRGLDIRDYNANKKHNEQVINRIKIAPKIFKHLSDYLPRIKCDHIFLGVFHNGTASISGVPFYKFDIIAEKFNPQNKQDTEFANFYQNIDIIRHDKLPITLVQNNGVHYIIDENGKSDLLEVDEIIYRRMLGRGVKQLMIHILRDTSSIPFGFIGCVKYNFEEMNYEELRKCSKDIENVYVGE